MTTEKNTRGQSTLANQIAKTVSEPYDAEDVPLPAYVALMCTYAAGFILLQRAAAKRETSDQISLSEFSLLTLASYKLSRIVTMSFIASPLRAPFTTRGKSLKGGEVQDEARGEGFQKAIGNLVTCPFCFNVWSTTAFVFGHAFLPKLTTRLAQVLSIAALADVFHHGYRTLRERAE